MAAKLLVHLCLASIFLLKQVSGYYCDSDKCSVDEYCCGVNQCCTSYAAWQMWYFWCGLVFFVILLSACAGFCKYRFHDADLVVHSGAPYSRLEDEKDATFYTALPAPYPGHGEKTGSAEPPMYTPNYPPPVYTSGTEKDPNYKR